MANSALWGLQDGIHWHAQECHLLCLGSHISLQTGIPVFLIELLLWSSLRGVKKERATSAKELDKNIWSSFCFDDCNILCVFPFFLSLFFLIYYLKVYGLAYNLSKIPTSKKGYTFGARTAERFKVINKVRNGLNVLRFSCDPCCYMYLHWEAKRGEWEVTKKCALKFQKNI